MGKKEDNKTTECLFKLLSIRNCKVQSGELVTQLGNQRNETECS